MTNAETRFDQILKVLTDAQVNYIVIGALGAMAHGSAVATYDVDVVYGRDRENLKRLAAALEPYSPYLRGVPPGLPFSLDEKTLRMGLNFTLTTTLGDLDLLGDATGAGGYEELYPKSKEVTLFGVQCRCASLEELIQMKRAAGRPKDLLVLPQLIALLEETRKIEKQP